MPSGQRCSSTTPLDHLASPRPVTPVLPVDTICTRKRPWLASAGGVNLAARGPGIKKRLAGARLIGSAQDRP